MESPSSEVNKKNFINIPISSNQQQQQYTVSNVDNIDSNLSFFPYLIGNSVIDKKINNNDNYLTNHHTDCDYKKLYNNIVASFIFMIIVIIMLILLILNLVYKEKRNLEYLINKQNSQLQLFKKNNKKFKI